VTVVVTSRHGGTTRSWRPILALVAVLAVAAVAAVTLADRSTPTATPVTAAEVTGYQQALLPIAQEWGSVEVLGMQPAVSDLVSGKGVPPETIRGEAAAWRSTFTTNRTKLHAISTPPALRQATALFDRALLRYIDAARLLGDAAALPAGKSRLAAVDRGIAAARDGDRLYNEASMLLQRVRHRVGLEGTTDFPDHPAGD
jgi:hypothetical protein